MNFTNETIFITIICSVIIISFLILLPYILKFVKFLSRRTNFKNLGQSSQIRLIHQLYDAVEQLSLNKIGALITIVNKVDLSNFRTDGIIINSNISSSLIIAIFNKNSPIHDGAIIIENNKITYVATYFKITSKSVDNRLGARHRAALGISEQSDSLTIVVSETNGDISFAKNGVLNKIKTSEFQEKLIEAIK